MSAPRADPVGSTTAQLQGTSLVRERPRGPSSAVDEEQNALCGILTPPAVDGMDEWGILPASTHSYQPDLRVRI